MAEFDSIIGHEVALGLLGTLLANDSLAHALLFCGSEGVGKATVAKLLAMALNCERRHLLPDKWRKEGLFPEHLPCKKCRTCRSIAAGNHPDVTVLDAEGKPIKIDQVRQLIAALSMKAFGAGNKVAVIDSAQFLTHEAANALLKILEEPPRDTVIILTASKVHELLPTIVSRCQQIRFGGVEVTTLSGWLARKVPGLDDRQAKVLAAMADGRPAKALELADRGIALRDGCLAATGLDSGTGPGHAGLSRMLAWAAETAANAETLSDKLSIIETWLRDLVVATIEPGLVINSDRKEDLLRLAGQADVNYLLDCFDSLLKVRRQLEAHANRRLALEVLGFRLAGIHAG